MQAKTARYEELVNQRKLCNACDGLVNPASFKDGAYDSDQIGAWSLWQGNLNAKLLVVGQDWGTCAYGQANKGKDIPTSGTNDRLLELLRSRGYRIEKPDYSPDVVTDHFFTNGILCWKNGGMQDKVKPAWFKNCGARFLRPTIEIVSPKIVVSLGSQAYRGILNAYGLKPAATFREAVESKNPVLLGNDIRYFPVYHCAPGRTHLNRSWDQQKQDWSKIPLEAEG